MIKELDSVVLTTDLPDLGLRQGDLGTVVLVHREGGAHEVEFTLYRTVRADCIVKRTRSV